jgi:peroxiredoxin
MAQLRQDYPEYIKRGTEVLVVGPDSAGQFKRFWQEHNLRFPGLPDPKNTVLKLYGQEINMFKFGRLPAQVIVDRQGKVRYIHYGKSMADIPSGADMLAILDRLNSEVFT